MTKNKAEQQDNQLRQDDDGPGDPQWRGALFREEELLSDKSPQFRGKLAIAGVPFRLAAWVMEDSSGRKWLSLAARPLQRARYSDGGDLF